MAYRAEIEIGVVGASRLKELQDRITKLTRAIDDANLKTLIDRKAIQSLAEYSSAAGKAAANLRETAIQLDAAGKASGNYANAINQLVTAVGQENSALQLQNKLITEEIELRRKAKLTASGVRETTQYGGPLGPWAASPVALATQLRGRTEQILAERKGIKELADVQQYLYEKQRQLENSKLDEKAAAVQVQLDRQAAAAAESAAQIDKLNQRQAEFTARTEEAAQAARRQTSAFYRQQRIAREVAALTRTAPTPQLLLPAAAPGAPLMGGGARRRITGSVERLGGARTADEAAATLRLAKATDVLASNTKKIDPQYNRFLPDTAALNAVNRGLQRLTTDQEQFNQTLQRGIRFTERYNQELERRRRLGIGGPVSNRMPGTTGVTGGPFPVEGPIPLSQFGRRTLTRGPSAGGGAGRLGGIASNAIIGGAFPLLFGQGGGAATGGAIGGAVGGLFGGAGGFAGSLLGTLLGQIAGQANQVKELAADIGFSAQQTQILGTAFKQAGADFDKFAESVSRIQGVGLALEEQASAIQLASTLTEAYGGKIDKITNAFTNALQTGKVTQATLNQLTSQGIPIQDALAAKYNVSRDALLLMAKDGKISVQDLLDTLVNLANESSKGPTKISNAYKEAFDEIRLAVDNLSKKLVDSFNFQSDSAGKAGENLAYRVSGAFAKITQELTPVLELLAQTSGAFINLGVKAVDALSGIPNLVSGVANAIIGMIPGLGSAYSILRSITVLTGKGRQPGIATPLNLNQGMGQNWPAGIPRPGTPSRIARIMAPAQMPESGSARERKNFAAERAAQDAAREAERVAKLLRDTQAQTQLLRIQADLQDKIFLAEQAKNPLLVARLQGEERILQIQARYAELIANEPNIRAQEALVAKGLQEIENSRLQTAQAFEKIEADRLDKYNTLIEDLNLELELKNLTTEQDRERLRIEFEINRLRKDNTYSEEQLLELQRKRLALAAQDSPSQKRMKELSSSLAELTNTENLAIAAADNIGLAFSQAFQDIANGASSGQEAIANMMKSIGENFVNMAAQIIAQQVTMIILGTILKALGIGGGGGAAPSGTSAGGISGSSLPGGFANPLVGQYSAPRANGGPAVGGTPYLVGERGPELFVPGTSGNVMSNNDLRQSMNSGRSLVLNMSFETTRFGDTEYVSRDQLEAAMSETRRQASRDGAQRGMTMTLDRLQQSPRTRSRLGMR